MKINFSFPATGCQKLIDIDDEKKVRFLYEKRMSAHVSIDPLGDEFKGYVCKISGGNDKQGFPMKQGVLTAGRVRLLLSKGHTCFRLRRSGERRRKSVHGCIVDGSLSVVNLVVMKKGEQEIPGLTDKTVPRRLGPKRASKIRRLFNLSKQDDVRQYVVRRPLPAKDGKKAISKAPKIQRLVTPLVLQRKRHKFALKRRRAAKQRDDKAEYTKLLAQRMKQAKERKMERRRSASQSKSRDSHGDSVSIAASKKAAAPKKVVATKAGAPAKGKASAKAKVASKAAAVTAKGKAAPKGVAKGKVQKAQPKVAAKGKAAAKGATQKKPATKAPKKK